MSLYGFIIGIAIVVGINYFTSHNTIVPKPKENLFLILGLIFSILGARLYHVIDRWAFYSQHLNLIPTTWNGGLGIYGAILAALLYIFVYCLVSRIKFLSILDLITPILPLCQSIGRFGNFINHEIPIWWLESGLCFLLFLFIKKFPQNPTAKYLIGYGLIRFIDEFFRNDTWQIDRLKIAQLISVIFVAVGLILIRGQRHQITQNHS